MVSAVITGELKSRIDGVWNAFWATEVLSAIVSLIVYKKSV